MQPDNNQPIPQDPSQAINPPPPDPVASNNGGVIDQQTTLNSSDFGAVQDSSSPTPQITTEPTLPPSPTPPPPEQLNNLGSHAVVYEPAPLPGEKPAIPPAGPVEQERLQSNILAQATAPTQDISTESQTTDTGSVPIVGAVPYQPPQQQPAQFTPTATQSTTEPVTSPAAAATAPVAAPAKAGKLRKILIFVGIFFAILIGGLVLAGIIRNRSDNSQQQAAENAQNNSESNGEANQGSAPADLPEGYVLVDKLCFSFGIIDDNLVIGSEDSCFVQAKYGVKGVSTLNIFPETNSYANLDEFVAAKKKAYNTQVISEENIKIDNIDAKKVIENIGGASGTQTFARVYVLSTGKTYTYQDSPVTGFEINSYYNDDFTRGVFENVLKTWRWK